MATWINRPNSRNVLDAAGRWKQQCLIEDGSLFSPERLWSAANADSLCDAFLGNPIVGSEKFIDKLERQLSNSPATVQHGARGEPAASRTKRHRVQRYPCQI